MPKWRSCLRTQKIDEVAQNVWDVLVLQDKGEVADVDNVVLPNQRSRNGCLDVPLMQRHIGRKRWAGWCCIQGYIQPVKTDRLRQFRGQVSQPDTNNESAFRSNVHRDLRS